MDPVSLTFGGAVAALVSKAAEQAVEQVGERVADGGSRALLTLKDRVRDELDGQGDAAGLAALARIEDPPAGARQLEALATAIDGQVRSDPRFHRDLEGLIAEAQDGGVDIGSVVQSVWRKQHVPLAGISDSPASAP